MAAAASMQNGTDARGLRPVIARASTDLGPRNVSPAPATVQHHKDDDGWELRHGYEDEYNSEEYLAMLNSAFYMYYTEKRHETGGKPKRETKFDFKDTLDGSDDWRVKSRIKTVFAGLMLCLNIGVDPPDVVKTNPTACLEAWVDPSSPSPSTKIMETIGKSLQQQYETLSMRIRYKQFLDPSVDETRRCCLNLRRNSKEERVLFHYNGHGVPLPTSSGEIWYFNRNYTQYIPVSLYDLQQWLAGPTIYVLDVSHAGNIVANFDRMLEKHEQENREALAKDPSAIVQNYSENIILAACGKDETLPTNPDLPADLFTSCLTTPVAISLRCFLLQTQFPTKITLKDLERVPGRLTERRTPLGELNWIFTAITDTIAWNCLPRDIFKKLFRQDLMVAALFRNYLLADRIMRANSCIPETEPALPKTHEHVLWQSWDLAIEMVLAQLPALLAMENGGPYYEYQHSSFFAEQLTAFEVYLSQGALEKKAPDQLPIVLQVLLSQVHRLRALILLGRFLDLGPWAVNLALKIGIFPYVLKLLQSAANELKPVLIFIWTRILAVDQSCQTDLLRDNGYKYFLSVVKPEQGLPVQNQSEHRAMSAFIVSMFCKDFHQAQMVSLSPELFKCCINHLRDTENPLLRQWSCLCIAMLWQNYPEAKWLGTRADTHRSLCQMVLDPVPEVRAAALQALTTYLGTGDITEQSAYAEQAIASTIIMMASDGNSMVRNEVLVFFSTFVKRYQSKFLVAGYEELLDQERLLNSGAPEHFLNSGAAANGSNSHVPGGYSNREEFEDMNQYTRGALDEDEDLDDPSKIRLSRNTIFGTMWKHLLVLSVDPHPEVAQNAAVIIDFIHVRLLSAPVGKDARKIMNRLNKQRAQRTWSRAPSPTPLPRVAEIPADQQPRKNESYMSLSIKKTASYATALKNLALGTTNNSEPSAQGQPSSSASSASSQKQSNSSKTSAAGSVLGLRSRVPDEWSRPPNAHDPTPHSSAFRSAKAPLPHGFDPFAEPQDRIPLKSDFFEWSVEYFREPQMKSHEPEEPGSDDYNSRLWRRMRNERTLNVTQPLKDIAGSSAWNIPKGSLPNGNQPMKLCLHQFEEHLAVADDRDTVSIWNWDQKLRLNRFSNGNPEGCKVNEIRFINEDDQALLVTGSSDGSIKIFRDYDSDEKVELVAAFRGITDILPSTRSAGLVMEWQQGQGKLLVAGDVQTIRIWNAATEICTNELPSRSNSCVTALTTDQVAGNVFVAGFGNGKVCVYDQREKPATSMVQRYSNHKQWIVNVHMQRGGMRELISGSRNGEVKLWDIRMKEEIRTINATPKNSTMRTLSVHEHAPVFATGSENHQVSFFNVDGTLLNKLEPAAGFLQSRSNPIAASLFHPHLMMMACTSLGDQHINLFKCVDAKPAVKSWEYA